MTLAQLLIVAAVVASVLLLTRSSMLLWPAIAVVASGIEALLAFGVVSLSVSGVNLGFVLAAALTVAGGGAWMREHGKPSVTAATVLVLVGATQLAGYLL